MLLADGPWKIIKNVWLSTELRSAARTGWRTTKSQRIDVLKGRHHSRRFNFNELFAFYLPSIQGLVVVSAEWMTDQPDLCIYCARRDENIMTGCLWALFISVCLYRSIHLLWSFLTRFPFFSPSSRPSANQDIARDHDPWNAPGNAVFWEQPQWKVKNEPEGRNPVALVQT